MHASPTYVSLGKSVDPSHQDDAAMTENAEPVSVLMQGDAYRSQGCRRAMASQVCNAQKKDKSVSTIPVTTAILKPEGLTVSVCVFSRRRGIAPKIRNAPTHTGVEACKIRQTENVFPFKAKEDCVADWHRRGRRNAARLT